MSENAFKIIFTVGWAIYMFGIYTPSMRRFRGAKIEREHTRLVEDHAVFGVPTFIAGGEAVFVRFMERHRPDDVARVIDMIGWSNLNEFKRTTIPR